MSDPDQTQQNTMTNPAPDPPAPRAALIVLNSAFVDALEPEQVRAYVEALVATSGEADRDEDSLVAALRQRLDGTGVVLPEESYKNLARQIRDHGGAVSVGTDDGRILHGTPELAPSVHEPDVHGTDDPDDPDRPFYS